MDQARRLKLSRRKAGFTQGALAENFNISTNKICRMENGKTTIPKEILKWMDEHSPEDLQNDVGQRISSLFFPDPFHCPRFSDGENVQMVMARTQAFLRKLIQRNDEKTYLIATHGCALRAMLNFLYEDSADFWHGHVPYNCSVNIVEAKDGVAKLIADDKIYYPEEMIVDRYK